MLRRFCQIGEQPLLKKESIATYEFFKFTYVKEEANLVAHKLPCYAVLSQGFHCLEDPLDFIVNIFSLDAPF